MNLYKKILKSQFCSFPFEKGFSDRTGFSRSNQGFSVRTGVFPFVQVLKVGKKRLYNKNFQGTLFCGFPFVMIVQKFSRLYLGFSVQTKVRPFELGFFH